MIDWNAPIALENGAYARVEEIASHGGARVYIDSSFHKYKRHYSRAWNYNSDGTWVGRMGDDYYRIVNVDDSKSFIPEDWS